MTLDKKLGIWGKDKIIREDNKFLAKDYYCIKCYSDKKETPAEVFWPTIDLDIKSYPYCKPCKDYLNLKLMIDLSDLK